MMESRHKPRRGLIVEALLVLVSLAILHQVATCYDYRRSATQRAVGSVIPQPKEISYLDGINYLSIEPTNFRLHLDELVKSCAVVELAADRYLDNYFFDDLKPEDRDDPHRGQARRRLGSIDSLYVGSANDNGFDGFVCSTLPDVLMDEAYTLTVTNETAATFSARLVANSCWGLLRGLETFSQLVFNVSPGIYGIQPVIVRDEPRFLHRGFMLDTARHFISVDKIFKLLDAMAINKLNVFHWHLVDDQSFPYVSSAYPQLSQKTAFRPHLVYRKRDVRSVIEYAAARGIRVMPELDSPGHTYAMRYIPGLLTECYDKQKARKNGDFGPVNPTRNSSFESIDKLLREFKTVFPDQFLHAGGDEVDFDCWESSPEINHWMEERNFTLGDYKALSNYYIRRMHDLIVGQNRKTMLVWQEVFDDGASFSHDRTVIHVWKDINDKPKYMAKLKQVVDAGYMTLLSSCWYLNYIDYGQDWVKFYQCDPRAGLTDKKQADLVLGGEICMWTEFVDDVNVVSRSWPRASAAAERLWSPESVSNTSEFLGRLEQMRCRLLARNIQAEPVNGPGYC